jgi:hypothetical protein
VPHTAVQRNAFASAAPENLPFGLYFANRSVGIDALLTQIHSILPDAVKSKSID